MTFNINNFGQGTSAFLLFNKKVNPVPSIHVRYSNQETDDIFITMDDERPGYEMGLTEKEIKRIFFDMNGNKSMTFTIIFKDLGPVKFVVPIDACLDDFINP